MKRLLPLFLAVSLLLCACAAPAEPPTTNTSTSTTTTTTGTTTTGTPPGTTGTTPPATSEVTQPSTPAPVLYRNPLSGEAMDAPPTQRPMAVMLNNVVAAMPQHGVSQAEIVYEALIEGGSTRCMGIFTDVSDIEAIGAIRSARKYFVEVAHSYDAVYAHAGGSAEAMEYLERTGWDDLDGIAEEYDYFYRDQDRLNGGYAMEHTLFVTGANLITSAQRRNYALTREDPDFGLTFGEGLADGSAADAVTVYFNRVGSPSSYTKKTAFAYNSADGLYYASQYGAAYIDGNSDQTVAFRNVLALRMETVLQDNGVLLTITNTGSGEGIYACNGYTVPIRWHRETVEDPYTYTLADGTPLTLGVGSSYIALIPTNAAVEVQ